MDASEPRVRRRGFFLHSSDGSEPDMGHGGDHENPEGLTVRVRIPRRQKSRSIASPDRARFGGRSHRTDPHSTDSRPEIRSGSVTGSRQRAHLPR